MSGVRQALRRTFRHAFVDQPGRWWHFLLTVLLVLLSVPVFAGLALTARLWVGPIDVTDSVRRLVAGPRPDLTLDRVRLSWDGWRHGPSAPVGLLIDGATLGQTRLRHAFAAFDVIALLHGRAALVALVTADSRVALYRDRAGGITVQAPRPDEPGQPPARRPANRLDLGELRRVDITRSTVILHDAASGRSCRADVADLLLQAPDGAAVTGHLAASLSCGPATADVAPPELVLRGEGRLDPRRDAVWRITSAPVVPAAFAHLVPALAPLAALDLPVGLALTTTLLRTRPGGFDHAVLPRALKLTAELGAGSIRTATAKPDDPGVAVAGGHVDLALSLPGKQDGTTRLVLSGTVLQLAGTDAPALRLAGTLSRTGSRIHASLETRMARFDFARLQQIWPQQLAGGARRWMTENVTAGSGHDLAVRAGLESDSGWDGLHLGTLSGSLDATGLTLYWLRPIAPLHGMDAHLVLEGPDALRIECRHAVEDVARGTTGQGVLTAGPATMRITGLTRKDQLARLDLHLEGALQDLLALLSHPRLRLLSRHPLSFDDPSGTVQAHLALSIPLVDQVSADDIPIRAEATLTDVHLGDVAVHRDLDRATLSLAASNDGLQVHGQGTFGGLPSTLSYEMDFRSGGPGQTTESAHLAARVDAAAVRGEGLDDAHRFTGEGLLDLGYERRRSGSARIALALDLTGSGLDTPFWRKSPGAAAQAAGVIGLQDDRVVSIDRLHASGPGLLLDAHADVGGGRPQTVVIERFTVGRSQGAGRIELPTPGTRRAIRVMLHGPVLDLVPYLRPSPSSGPIPPDAMTATKGPASKPAASSQTAWRADAAFRRVLFSAAGGFSGVTLHAEANGTRVSNASLSIGGPTPVTATLTPDQGGRRLVLDAQDAGALLASFGVGERIQGGVLNLQGRMEDRPSGMRLTALAKVGPFTVQDAPLAARLARDLSIYGLLTRSASPQLAVTRFEIPFTLEGDTLRLTGARASNVALGATLRGPIDLRQQTFDLRGTIVPSYLFNALPGKLPGIGKVFSPEQGGGLLAVTLSITGPMDRPAIKVNPLALLAPGILRRLLFD